MVYNICGKSIALSDEVEKEFTDYFGEVPPDFVAREHLESWEGHNCIEGVPVKSLKQIISEHSEAELSDMLDRAMLYRFKDVYNAG